MNKEITEILEENIYPVSYKLSTAVNINNNGILNSKMLEKARRAFMMETFGVWGEELITTAQGYPENDISDVIFSVDCVVLKRKDFDKLREYYDKTSS